MRVGPVLEDAIQAGNERDFVLHLVQRSQSGRERPGVDAGRDGLPFKPPDVVLTGKLRQRPISLAGKEAAPRDSVRHVEESKTLCRCGRFFPVFGVALIGEALKPGEAQCDTAGTRKKSAA